jgi:hypothetical protein
MAKLMGTPIMLVITILAARLTVRRLAVPSTSPARLGVGFVALGLLLVVEFTLVLWLRGQQFVSTSQAETLRPGRSTTRRLECLPSCRLCWLEDDIADPIPCCTLVDILPITRKIVGGDDGADERYNPQ